MKRVLTFLAIMLLPLSVMAMTPVTDSDLADVTGQAGVNINADLMMNIGIGTMAWGDRDGLEADDVWGTDTAGGYVGVTNFNITNLRIKARETDTFNGYIPYYDTDTSDSTNPAISDLKPITIDVATDAGLYGGQTFVRFGLGSLQISMDAMDLGVELGSDTALGQVMGYAHIGPMAVYINPLSYVDIYAQATDVGVGMTMNIIVDQFSLSYMSWEDSDGQDNMGIGAMPWMYTGMQSAGFIGLEDLVVGGPITITGTVYIDVTTSAGGIYSHGFPWTVGGAYAPVSVVHISFPELFNVNVAGPITANVKLDSVAALNSANAGELGNIYLTGFNLDILAGSWVDIWAH